MTMGRTTRPAQLRCWGCKKFFPDADLFTREDDTIYHHIPRDLLPRDGQGHVLLEEMAAILTLEVQYQGIKITAAGISGSVRMERDTRNGTMCWDCAVEILHTIKPDKIAAPLYKKQAVAAKT